MALIPAFGGVVQFGQVFWLTWQMPIWTVPHQPGTFLGDGSSHLRMMILATFLTTVALTLAAGFYLIYTFRAFGKNDSLLQGAAHSGFQRKPAEKSEDGHPPGEHRSPA